MTWVVFVVSVVLAAAGAFAIVSGAPIIQIERGWTEVIAGSVALSSGMVVFALGVVALHLLDIRRALEDVPDGAAAAALESLPSEAALMAPALDDISEPIESTPDVANPATVPPEDASVVETSQRHALWKRVRGSETAMDLPITEGRSQPPGSFAGPPVIDPEPIRVAASAMPAPELAVDRDETTPTPSVRRGRDPVEDRSYGQSSLASMSHRRSVAAAPPSPTTDRLDAPVRDAPLRGTLADHADVEPASQPDHGKPADEAAAELAEHNPATVTEVGRYQAESASYIMYSDGTIQVETENGDVHRFGSMSELRVYIGRQDQTAE